MPDDGSTLLEVLREHLGLRSLKDGCSPQGQCGCCTVWVDGSPRVACVTPVRRLEGREVIVDIPSDHKAAAAWGDGAGLTRRREFWRMTRGESVVEDLGRLWASSGPEMG